MKMNVLPCEFLRLSSTLQYVFLTPASYLQVCRGVSWSTSMQLLQLIGVCLSGPTLAHIFHTMCSNHKHFSAGLPDLFMWRVLAPQGVPFVHCLPAHRLSRCEDVVDLTLSQDSSDVVATSAVVASAGATTSSSPASVPVTLSVEDTPSSLPSLTVSGGPVDPFQDVPDYQLVPGAVYQCRCVEVKGPRDRLSDKQEAWIHLLLDAGCDVDVCHVRESNHKDVAVLVASGKSKTL